MNPTRITPIRADQPEKSDQKIQPDALGIERVYLLTIDHTGAPTITPVENIREMLFGDETYLVIPYTK